MPESAADRFLSRKLQRLKYYELRQVAVVAFVIGVLLHLCVAYAVLDGGSSQAKPIRSAPITQTPTPSTSQKITPSPTPLTDRTSCDAIRGTDYRSANERQWFLSNCSGP